MSERYPDIAFAVNRDGDSEMFSGCVLVRLVQTLLFEYTTMFFDVSPTRAI